MRAIQGHLKLLWSGLALLRLTVTRIEIEKTCVKVVSSNSHYSDSRANDSFDLLTPVKAHEFCDYTYARHADRRAETGSKREERSHRNEPDRWDEDDASPAVLSAAAFQKKNKTKWEI